MPKIKNTKKTKPKLKPSQFLNGIGYVRGLSSISAIGAVQRLV